MHRRAFLATAAAAMLPLHAAARVQRPYSWGDTPPQDTVDAFVAWMQSNRGEDPSFLRLRYDRFMDMVDHLDLLEANDKRAFLLTPREEFCFTSDAARVYDTAYLAIGYGVTISGPRVVGRMTSALNLEHGEKVLEIGTGSGYQSAYLANLTDKVWSIEIIKPLAERTRKIYNSLIDRGYTEYKSITTKHADGYYGWEELAPFDKIIVTCGIDHIPPPLLQQLKANGTMVVPIGPPGAQRVLKVDKQRLADGKIAVRRSDIYDKPIPFVPFTKLEGAAVRGTYNNMGETP